MKTTYIQHTVLLTAKTRSHAMGSPDLLSADNRWFIRIKAKTFFNLY